jgi:hypothetical protein
MKTKKEGGWLGSYAVVYGQDTDKQDWGLWGERRY